MTTLILFVVFSYCVHTKRMLNSGLFVHKNLVMWYSTKNMCCK